MKYSIGTNLADFGFGFLEKIHEPIFLIHRLGKITKINEAGRKLLCISKVSLCELDAFVASHILDLFKSHQEGYRRLKVGNNGLHLIARSLGNSDFILVEVKR
jgi:hypothetical protein